MYFKIGVLKNFAMFTRKYLCWSLRPAALLKKRLQHRCSACEYCEIFENSFFYRTSPVTASELCVESTFFERHLKKMSKHLLGKDPPPRRNPPWRGEGATLTKRFQPVHQQEEFVGAMLLRLIRINWSSFKYTKSTSPRTLKVHYQGLGSILKFVVTLAFPS